MVPGKEFLPLAVAVETGRMCRAVAVEVEPADPAILFPDFLLLITDGGNVACDCSMPADVASPVWNTAPDSRRSRSRGRPES
jgi:hypothetical protein